MTDDGAYVYYLNSQTGERRRDPPVNPSAGGGPISVNRNQDFDSRSVSPASPGQIDLNRDILDDDSDLDVDLVRPTKVSTSSSMRRTAEGPLEESRRRMREIEDRLSSSEPEGIPVLALKVRTTIRALRDALGWRADTSQRGTTEGDEALYESCKRADENLTVAKSAVVAATRCLIVASGVLAPSSESLEVLAGVAFQSNPQPLRPNFSRSSSSNSNSNSNPVFVASEQLKFSHRKVTTSLTRLTFSVRHFQHTTDWITTDEELDAGVHADAEDVERVVVAFGLEAERERSSRVVSGINSSTEYKPRRLEGWLDSIGVGLPVGGRNGFSTEIDADLLVRPFGIDASEPGLRPLQAKALKTISTLDSLFSNPTSSSSADLLLPVYSDLIRKVTLVQQHVRSFNIATSLDLDGEEEPSPTETAYAALVLKAHERLRDYEDALDALHDRAGFLMSIRGYRSEEECRAVVGEIQSALLAIVPAFLGLWEVSFAQAQAVRNGTKGKIGLRRPAAAPPSSSASSHPARSTSRLSMTSVRSRGSIGSRRSHLLSLRGKGGGGARGLDEEVLEKELADEEELRDQVDARAFAMGGGGGASSTASTSQVSIPMSGGGRARQGSLSALSSASSVPSFDMSAAMEAQSSRLSGGGKGAMEALGILRSRRESDDAGELISSSIRVNRADFAISFSLLLLLLQLPWTEEEPVEPTGNSTSSSDRRRFQLLLSRNPGSLGPTSSREISSWSKGRRIRSRVGRFLLSSSSLRCTMETIVATPSEKPSS
ncbi:hypothetical protein BDY24DRAFT_159027 [Mrakia frigida]|uniref:uncharacterized protein n=1 Tax=Mrakia frigida TaxID=29902 RepID=UPI003FCBFF86